MTEIGVFPFGQPILPLTQQDRSPKKVFVLGVYASAVHARWINADGDQNIAAVGVASEPEIFWRGGTEAAAEIIARIKLPDGAGSLEPADDDMNGPSGRALDDSYLKPLGLTRNDTWLCDLVPYSCMNFNQGRALDKPYDKRQDLLGLPKYTWPTLPVELTDKARRTEIEQELIDSKAQTLICLGDQPLRWFASHYGAHKKLSKYGTTPEEYGLLHPLDFPAQKLNLLPLVHPRQAAKLGRHSARWAELHAGWVKAKLEG